MGNFFDKLWKRFQGIKSDYRIIMIGLDGAGKTSILYKFFTGEQITTIPTIGFNLETIEYKNLSFTVWDIGGQDRIRKLWRHYYHNLDGIIFVVDSTDIDRIDDYSKCENNVKQELFRMLAEDELRDVPLLIFANKQDMKKPLTAEQIIERLELAKVRDRQWYVQASSAATGYGLYEGLDWLSNIVVKNSKVNKGNAK